MDTNGRTQPPTARDPAQARPAGTAGGYDGAIVVTGPVMDWKRVLRGYRVVGLLFEGGSGAVIRRVLVVGPIARDQGLDWVANDGE